MPSTQQLLQAIGSMQQNTQAALPVIPNNGNPRGANNMPSNPAMPAPRPAMPGGMPAWAEPSASMEIVRQLLAQPLQGPTAVSQPAMPLSPAPLPALPARGSVLPQDMPYPPAMLPRRGF